MPSGPPQAKGGGNVSKGEGTNGHFSGRLKKKVVQGRKCKFRKEKIIISREEVLTPGGVSWFGPKGKMKVLKKEKVADRGLGNGGKKSLFNKEKRKRTSPQNVSDRNRKKDHHWGKTKQRKKKKIAGGQLAADGAGGRRFISEGGGQSRSTVILPTKKGCPLTVQREELKIPYFTRGCGIWREEGPRGKRTTFTGHGFPGKPQVSG